MTGPGGLVGLSPQEQSSVPLAIAQSAGPRGASAPPPHKGVARGEMGSLAKWIPWRDRHYSVYVTHLYRERLSAKPAVKK
jgi:hypothetical protein